MLLKTFVVIVLLFREIKLTQLNFEIRWFLKYPCNQVVNNIYMLVMFNSVILKTIEQTYFRNFKICHGDCEGIYLFSCPN